VGKPRFNIINRGSEPRDIVATLVSPAEFSSAEPGIRFEIDPRAEKALTFDIRNSSALEGAGYPLFCFFEYDLKDIHYTAVAGAYVNIERSENRFKRTRPYWIGVTLLLGIAIVSFERKRRR